MLQHHWEARAFYGCRVGLGRWGMCAYHDKEKANAATPLGGARARVLRVQSWAGVVGNARARTCFFLVKGTCGVALPVRQTLEAACRV